MKIGPLEINFRRLGMFLAFALILVLVMNFSSRLGYLAHIQNKVATVYVQATGIVQTQQVLQTQVAYATSPAAVDQYARDEAHMGKPGDKVVILLPVPGATPEPTPTPIPVVNDLTPLNVWKLFILGK